MAEVFQPGQRVRHRYEHWWGTVVKQADVLSGPAKVPVPIVYVVTIDGGKQREDIRPDDLTLT